MKNKEKATVLILFQTSLCSILSVKKKTFFKAVLRTKWWMHGNVNINMWLITNNYYCVLSSTWKIFARTSECNVTTNDWVHMYWGYFNIALVGIWCSHWNITVMYYLVKYDTINKMHNKKVSYQKRVEIQSVITPSKKVKE